MKKPGYYSLKNNCRVGILLIIMFLLALIAGCGGSGTALQATSADETAILLEMQSSGFFTDSLTDTHTEEDAAAAAQALSLGELSNIQSLSAAAGPATLPRFWWRGNIELLHKNIDISIVDDIASVTVAGDISGDFFVIDQIGDAYFIWNKPFEDTLIRHAEFEKRTGKWKLSRISPVELALTNASQQTVQIQWVRASVGSTVVWDTDSAATLFEVPDELPSFVQGDEVLVEAFVENSTSSGYEPASFVFLHRPCSLCGKRVRDIMYDDGTNGDITADDGVFSRAYVIGPSIGRHFAAVDAIDSAAFMDLEAPYNSNAWGMPYIVE